MAGRFRNPGLLAGVPLFARPALPLAAREPPETAICAGGPLYAGGGGVVADLRASGFTTLVAWTLHVLPRGDRVFNDSPIVRNGR